MALMKILVIHLFLMLPLAAVEFRSDWQGTRPWVGPEYWAGPLYDWKTVDGAVVAVAAKDRLLHLLSHQPVEPQKGFQMRVSVELLTNWERSVRASGNGVFRERASAAPAWSRSVRSCGPNTPARETR